MTTHLSFKQSSSSFFKYAPSLLLLSAVWILYTQKKTNKLFAFALTKTTLLSRLVSFSSTLRNHNFETMKTMHFPSLTKHVYIFAYHHRQLCCCLSILCAWWHMIIFFASLFSLQINFMNYFVYTEKRIERRKFFWKRDKHAYTSIIRHLPKDITNEDVTTR